MKKFLRCGILSSIVLLGGCEIRSRIPDLVPSPNSSPALNQGIPLKGNIVRVGAARAEFIPESPTALSGYGGVARRFLFPLFAKGGEISFCRPYEKIVQPPKIKTAVFEIRQSNALENQNLFLVSLDLVAVTSDMTQKIHAAIDEVTGKKSANLNNTLVVATHTHSGPAGLSENPLWSAFVCDQYNPPLANAYVSVFKDTLRRALGQLQNVESISTRASEAAQLLKSRFEGMRANNDVSLLSFNTANARAPLALLRMAVHPTSYGPSDLVLSADLVAPLEQAVGSAFDLENVFLLQTEIGNMTANNSNLSNDMWAKNVAEALRNTQSISSSNNLTMSTSAGTIELPSARINWSGCGASQADTLVGVRVLENLPQQAHLTFWRINDELNLFLPGEWTTSGATEVKNAFASRLAAGQTMKLHSLAHDYTGYHLSRSDYGSKALESCSSLYGADGTYVLSSGLAEIPLP